MKYLADIFLSVVDLAEAEMRALRRGLVRAGISVGMILVGSLLLLGALVWLIWAVFLAIQPHLGPSIAALLTGVATLVLAVVLLLVAKWAAS